MQHPVLTREFKTGIFVIAMLGLAVFSLVFVGIQKELFSEKVYYYVVSPTGEKIERGVPVKISGFRVGTVSDVQMHGIDYIKIELKVLKRYQSWFTRGVTVQIAGGFPIGSAWIEVFPGPGEGPVISPGTTLELTHDEGLVGSLQARMPAMLDDVAAILENTRRITTDLSEPDKDFHKTLANMQRLTGTIADAEGLVRYLLNDPEPVKRLAAVLKESEALLKGLNTVTDKASGSVDGINEVLAGVEDLLGRLNVLVANVDAMRAQLEPTVNNTNAISDEVRRATTDLVRLRSQAEYTLKLGTDVLERLKRTWPLRRTGDGQVPAAHPQP
ncbi:MlaD family protein [Desulfovibrio mangrovi]|uniref:MlaD family protein n=1 Tax=Desulfovibrio mangrovi TaxID=2976983 RepID=UPI00224808CC|nr:MlaD family protein [Desulfovibrio mangrovi]UZP68204.1 MlaD family protein [Desulfovibrio mangrovi]